MGVSLVSSCLFLSIMVNMPEIPFLPSCVRKEDDIRYLMRSCQIGESDLKIIFHYLNTETNSHTEPAVDFLNEDQRAFLTACAGGMNLAVSVERARKFIAAILQESPNLEQEIENGSLSLQEAIDFYGGRIETCIRLREYMDLIRKRTDVVSLKVLEEVVEGERDSNVYIACKDDPRIFFTLKPYTLGSKKEERIQRFSDLVLTSPSLSHIMGGEFFVAFVH